MKRILFAATGLVVLCLTGCMQTSGSLLPEYNNSFYSGDYSRASELANKKADEKDLLWAIQKASAEKNLNRYDDSNRYFDIAEETIKTSDEKVLAQTGGDYLLAMIGNATWVDYRPATHDGVLVNTFKATNLMGKSERDQARVEFNRALDRQERAKDFFAKEIRLQKDAIEKKREEELQKAAAAKAKGESVQAFDPSKSGSHPGVNSVIDEKYKSIFEFEAYPDFVNPYTTYMAALFFLLEKDYKKSVNLFKECRGMDGKNRTVLSDFELADQLASSMGEMDQNFSWVVFENGLGPIKKEWRLDLPIFLVSETVQIVSVALPTLEFRDIAFKNLVVNNGEDEFATESVASMDRVVQTEFKKGFPIVLTNAIISTAFKAFTQHFLSEKYGMWGKIGGAFYAAATTGADERSWTGLPKEFQVVRVPVNGQPVVVKSPDGRVLFSYEPKSGNSVAFVRMPTATAEVSYDVVYF